MNRESATWLSALWLLAITAAGCGSGELPQVSYDPRPIADIAVSVRVPPPLVEEAGASRPAIFEPVRGERGKGIAFEGTLHEGDPQAVIVLVYGPPDARGQRVIFANGLGKKTAGGNGKSYRVELVAPELPNEYDVEIKQIDKLIATGKLTIR